MAESSVVGVLRALLTLDVAEFEDGLKKANKGSKSLELSLSDIGKALAGAFTVGAVVAFAKEVSSFASKMNDLSMQTGIGVERLQALNYVGAAAGVTVEQMANAVAQLSTRLVNGEKGAVQAIEQLGLNVEDLIRMNPDQAFIAIGKALAGIPNQMERINAAREIFGRSGAQFLPLFTDELNNLVEAAEKSGAVMSKELIDKADEFDDLWAQGTIRVKAMTATLADYAIRASQAASVTGQMVESFKVFKDVTFGAAAGTELLEKTTNPLATKTMPKFGMSMREATEVAKELDKEISQKLTKAHEKAEEAILKQTKAYNALISEANNAQGLFQMKIDRFNTAPIQDVAKALVDVSGTADFAAAAFDRYFEAMRRINDEAKSHTIVVDGMQGSISQFARAEDELLGKLRESGTLIQENVNWNDQWRESLQSLSQSFLVFAQIAGDSLGQTIRQIGAAIAAVDLADKGLSSLTAGFKSLGSGSILKGLAGIAGGIGGIVGAAQAAIAVVTSLWHGLQRLFGGGEEGVDVNPNRDKFFAQYGGYEGLAQKLTAGFEARGDMNAGESARQLIASLYAADSRKEFDAAQEAIIGVIGGQKYDTGGLVPGYGNVPGILHGGERVLSVEQNKWFSNLMDMMPDTSALQRLSGGDSQRPIVVTVNSILDGKVIARSTMKYLPGELAVHGVR